jgi:hypothetical protein
MPAQSSSAARKTTPKAAPKRVAPPARVRLTVAHERAVYLTFAALLVTGAGWLVCHYLLSPAGEPAPLPHPLEGLWLELHGAAGMLALVVFGSLFTAHMTKAWALGRGRASGGTLAGLFVLLAATGYGLYYVADDDARSWISVIHWVVGLGTPILLVAHVWMLRTRLRRVGTD